MARAMTTHITDVERRRRIGVRHRLAPGSRATTLADAAAAMVAMHATDPAGVYLEARARMDQSSPELLSHEMYEQHAVLRMLAMRRTVFMASLDDVPLLHAAASRAVRETERRRTLKMLLDAGDEPDTAALLDALAIVGLAAVRQRGALSTSELRGWIPGWTLD